MTESSEEPVADSDVDIVGICLARNLVRMLVNHKFNVKRTLTLERNRIVKDRACAAMVLSKLMRDLGDEVEKNLIQSSSDKKFRIIKREIIEQEAKFNKLEEYEKKLGIALSVSSENCGDDSTSQPSERGDLSSSASSSAQSQTSSCGNTKFKQWRKSEKANRFVYLGDGKHQLSFEVLTPKIIEARREIKQLNDQLNMEIRRSEKTKSKIVQRRLQNLKAEISRFTEIIRGEEEFAKRFLNS